jgi:holo-[acyl-carrier protein] synthase
MFLENSWEAEVKRIGADITPISRIASWIDRYDSNTLNVVFASSEISQCQVASDPYKCYAICFATKEAVGKALGTGLNGIEWKDIEAYVARNELSISLHGKAKVQASRCFIQKWSAAWLFLDEHVLVHVLAQ